MLLTLLTILMALDWFMITCNENLTYFYADLFEEEWKVCIQHRIKVLPYFHDTNLSFKYTFWQMKYYSVSKSHCCKYTKKDAGKVKCEEESQPPTLHMWMRRVNKGCNIKLLDFVFMQIKQNKSKYLLIFIASVISNIKHETSLILSLQ